MKRPGIGLIHAVHHAERAIARVDAVHDDAQAEHVDDLVQRGALAAHLLVDAVEMLLAHLYFRGDLALEQRGGELLLDLLHELFLIAARAFQRALEHAIALRVQRPEAEVFQLQLHAVEAEAFGDRRVDLERFARDGAAPRRRHRLDRAHVVRAVGELDQDDAEVPHHREQHLAEAFRLRFLAALELDLVELGDGVDELGDVRAEAWRRAGPSASACLR